MQSGDVVRLVFEHWVAMFGRPIRRCKLGPTRRAAIQAMLTLYDADTLMLAIEGMAADPLADCRGDEVRAAMRELEWLFGKESRIERWADRGERLRAMAASFGRAERDPPAQEDAARSAADAQAARAQLAALAAQLRAGCGHG